MLLKYKSVNNEATPLVLNVLFWKIMTFFLSPLVAWLFIKIKVSLRIVLLWIFSQKYLLFFSHQSVVSDSMQTHGLQHTRPPCPSPSPEVCSSSCPLHQWCLQLLHPLMPSSPSALSFSQHQGLYFMAANMGQHRSF